MPGSGQIAAARNRRVTQRRIGRYHRDGARVAGGRGRAGTLDARRVRPLSALDAARRPAPYSGPQLNTGIDRDEYPACVITETRRLVRAGMAAAANGPGSPRTERGATDEDARADPHGADDQ